MPRKIIFLLTFVFGLLIIYNVLAHINGYAGATGAPSEVTCKTSGCHNTYALNAGPGSIAISHNIPASGYVPSTTYSVTVTLTQTGISLFGFDFVALSPSNTSAGTLVVTNSTKMTLMTSGGRSNITHKTNGGAGSSPMAFTFNWIAPSTNIGTVTFYTAGDACNNNGSENGDYVYSTSASIPAANVNTITTGNISSSAFCAGQTGIGIPFTITGTFSAGNIFTAQLSDNTGSFSSPTTIGSLTSVSAGTVTSSIALPAIAGTLFRIRVVSSNPATTGSSNSTNLTISLPPTASNAGVDQSVCGTTATLAGNTPTIGNGSWSLLNGSGTITSPTLANSAVTGLGVGANNFIWSITNGSCSISRDTVQITGVGTTTQAYAGIDQTACSNFATLAGNIPTAGTGQWTLLSGSGTITNPANAGTTVTGLSTGINSFIWTISNPPCASTRDTVIINHTGSITVANAGPDQKLCTITTTTLAANTPSIGTGVWTLAGGSGTFTNSSNPSTTVIGLASGQNVLVWTISNPPCSPSIDTLLITVLAQPSTANAGTDQVICTNTTTLGGNTPTSGTGLWTLLSGSGVITNPSNPLSTVTGIGLGTNSFIWTISNSPCADSRDTVKINFTGTITIANAGPTQTICSTSTTLAGNTPSVGSGLWSVISGSGTITNPTNPTTTVTSLSNGDIILRWTISNPPCTPSTSDVTIHNCTNNTIITGMVNGSPFCTNTSYSTVVPFTVSGIFNGFYSAEISDSSGSFSNPIVIGSGSASPLYVNIPQGSLAGTKYRVRVKNSNPVVIGTDNGTNLLVNTCFPNSITTGTISGSPFCKNTTYNLQVPFSYIGNFTGTFTAQLSDVNGLFTNPVVIGSGAVSPINCNINPLTAKGSIYRIRIINSTPNFTGTDNGADLEINTCNVLITDSIKGSPFCASTTYNVSIPFQIIGDVSAPYIAELSDLAGSFNNPVTIGYGNNSPIAATLPKSTPVGNNYRIRVKNSSFGITLIPNLTNLSVNTCKTGLSISNFKELASIYPNPNNGKFNLNFHQSADETYSIKIFNSLGDQIFFQTIAQIDTGEMISIDVSDAKPGIYFVKLESNNFYSALKIFIE